MYFLNIIDEQNRFLGLKAYKDESPGQDYHYVMSYLELRNRLKIKEGIMMGFDHIAYYMITSEGLEERL